MPDSAYKEALLEAERIYGLTEPASWFIRIHDEVDLKRIQTHEWLYAHKANPELDPNERREKSAGWLVSEMEQEHLDMRLSTYLHEYCHFLQLASSPYYLYLNTVQQYQSCLAIRLCRELVHCEIELPLQEFIKRRAKDSTTFQVLMKQYVEPWGRCERLTQFLEYGEHAETGESVKPVQLYFETYELLLDFNDGLRELTAINTFIKKVLSTFVNNHLTFDVVRPLISYQPGLKKDSLKGLVARCVEENGNRIGFGARAISEGAAASAQFFYLAASQSWRVESLKIISVLALDEYTKTLEIASEYEGFNRLDRYSKFFAFYTLCDLALQTPLHPVYSDIVGREFRWSWHDLHPGHRFRRALNSIDWNSVPQISQHDFEGLWNKDSQQEAARNVGAKAEGFSNQVCDLLGWPRASAMAESASRLVSRRDDFITKLRVKANRLRLECPGLLLVPISPEIHAALPPIGVFAGKEFRGNLMEVSSVNLNALISNYLLNTFSRQIMTKSSVTFYRQDSIVYSWLLSAKLIEEFKGLFKKIFWVAPEKVEGKR